MKFENWELQLLDAGYGDSIFISIKLAVREYNILIDGGLKSTYFNAKNRRSPSGPLKLLLDDLKDKERCIDLLVVTHIDDDHIGGICKWFEMDFPENNFVKQVWLNNDMYINNNNDLNNSVDQAISVLKKLQKNQIYHRYDIVEGMTMSNDFCTIRVIAPKVDSRNIVTKKLKASLDNTTKNASLPSINELLQQDWIMKPNSDENKASIAFELEIWDGTKLLLLGDAEYEDIMDGLNRFYKNCKEKLEYNYVKLSHHGSRNNFNPLFLDRILAKAYIVSTNGSQYGHPDKEVLAQIISKSDSSIIFNNESVMKSIFCEQDFIDYPNLHKRICIF